MSPVRSRDFGKGGGRVATDRLPPHGTRRCEQCLPTLAPGNAATEVADHRDPFAERDAEGIQAGRDAPETVTQGLVLRSLGKGAEQAIEDDEHAAVIAVETGGIAGVMNAMVARVNGGPS